jgi:hypothetical protein
MSGSHINSATGKSLKFIFYNKINKNKKLTKLTKLTKKNKINKNKKMKTKPLKLS